MYTVPQVEQPDWARTFSHLLTPSHTFSRLLPRVPQVEQPDCTRTPPPYYCFGGVGVNYSAALNDWDASRGDTGAAARHDRGNTSQLSPQESAAIARWAAGAIARSALGTCALPPPVRHSRCGTTIAYIRAHPSRHNLLSGVRFTCPSSLFRYLVACRPESGCARPEARWYFGREEINCNQKAIARGRTHGALPQTPCTFPPVHC